MSASATTTKTDGEWVDVCHEMVYLLVKGRQKDALRLLESLTNEEKRLLAEPDSRDAWTNDREYTILSKAVDENMTGVVQVLCDAGANVNVLDACGRAPLHEAAMRGRLPIMRLLLRAGADPNIGDNHKQTPLHLAAFLGGPRAVGRLLAADADVNAKDEASQSTPLHYAVYVPNAYTAAMLIGAGADVEAQTTKGQTMLHIAAKFGGIQTMNLLLDSGSPMDTKDENGLTPVDIAKNSLQHAFAAELQAAIDTRS